MYKILRMLRPWPSNAGTFGWWVGPPAKQKLFLYQDCLTHFKFKEVPLEKIPPFVICCNVKNVENISSVNDMHGNIHSSDTCCCFCEISTQLSVSHTPKTHTGSQTNTYTPFGWSVCQIWVFQMIRLLVFTFSDLAQHSFCLLSNFILHHFPAQLLGPAHLHTS